MSVNFLGELVRLAAPAFSAALLELSPAAAGTGIVTAGRLLRISLGVLPPHPSHDIGRRPLVEKFVRHISHRRIDVLKKQLVAGT